ncbi:MAG: ABC transporter permease [Bacteroidota bacterium]
MDFRKVKLVGQREYLTRIRRKTFILSTILVPLGFLLIFGISFGIQFLDSDEDYTVGVIDQTDEVITHLSQTDPGLYQDLGDITEEAAQVMVNEGDLSAYLIFTEQQIQSKSPSTLIHGGAGIEFISNIRSDVRQAIRDIRIDRANVSPEIRSIIENEPAFETLKLTASGAEEDNSMFYFMLALGMGFVIYFSMFIYGAIIMRGVIEEKTNRIVEIIASSVKPIELLVGKVLGVGALGLTQFAIWIAAVLGIMAASGPIMAMFGSSADLGASPEAQAAAAQGFNIPTIDPMLWFYLVAYFLLGYLIYSALFAAVGSAVDSETDTQQLQAPIMIPIILAFVLMPRVISAPDSTLAVVSSLIPFFSPILMLGRIPITDVPTWQILLSFGLMSLTFVGCMWLSAKIYRVGILMYGKKAGFKEIAKWIRYR